MVVQKFKITIDGRDFNCKLYYQLMDQFLLKSIKIKKLEDIEEQEKASESLRKFLISKMTVDPKINEDHLNSEECGMEVYELGFRLVEYLGKESEKRFSSLKKKDTDLPDSKLQTVKQNSSKTIPS